MTSPGKNSLASISCSAHLTEAGGVERWEDAVRLDVKAAKAFRRAGNQAPDDLAGDFYTKEANSLASASIKCATKIGDHRRAGEFAEESGEAYLRAGKPKEAAVQLVFGSTHNFHESVGNYPKSVELSTRAGEVFLQAGDPAKAADCFWHASDTAKSKLKDPALAAQLIQKRDNAKKLVQQ